MTDTRPAPHVLVADDEPAVLRLVSFALANAGFRVTSVADGTAAAEKLAGPGATFAAAVLDCRMPGATGPEVLAWVRGRGNPIPVVLLSGADWPGVETGDDPAVRFLSKPFSVAGIVGAVRDILATTVV